MSINISTRIAEYQRMGKADKAGSAKKLAEILDNIDFSQQNFGNIGFLVSFARLR
ncbi:MAG: hypothetical protein LBD95_02900 [Clostridiales Family XIII bacterium]|jgi:hypothetical protein|nr:hypothetical protein [Clostridiales Family XIII bacterium]